MTTNKGRKKTGKKYVKDRKKKKYERKGQRNIVKLGEEKKKKKRTRGSKIKSILLKTKFINVITKDNKKKKVEIKNVIETPSNRFLARQNVLTKGTIVKTELGNVRITNRPAQEGMINGVLVE